MADPAELIVKNVRCFGGEQRGRLRPITLLVGENSTGKSTFLACYSVLHRMLYLSMDRFGDAPDFNREPFLMGSFRDIVRSRRGPEGLIDRFELGLKLDQGSKTNQPTEIIVTFREQGSQPTPSAYSYRFGESDFIELRQQSEEKITLAIPGRELDVEWPPSFAWYYFPRILFDNVWPQSDSREAHEVKSYVRELLKINQGSPARDRHIDVVFRGLLKSKLIPVAPLRAKPRRTYDPVRESDSPEGEHIPMLMMRLDHSEKNKWRSLHDSLVEFGEGSGLFSDIKVRRHGKQISDPFQLQVKARSSSHTNIMDVGYGVSQSLPILVSLLSGDEKGASGRRRNRSDKIFLLQQPEVHLHPRGQAELGALFAKLVKKAIAAFWLKPTATISWIASACSCGRNVWSRMMFQSSFSNPNAMDQKYTISLLIGSAISTMPRQAIDPFFSRKLIVCWGLKTENRFDVPNRRCQPYGNVPCEKRGRCKAYSRMA